MSGAIEAPDPRPVVEKAAGDAWMLKGWRCTVCGHAIALPAPWCPIDREPLVSQAFGPAGTVWSATVVRVPLPGRTPPYAMAYVDLDDRGPRILAHVDETRSRLHAGARVVLSAPNAEGDPAVVATTAAATKEHDGVQ
jgi:uncharacterized OB-fold protein